MVTARDPVALERAAESLRGWSEVHALAGDVADPAHRERLTLLVASLGELDVLVNNAAVLGPTPRPALLECSAEDLTALWRTNALAPLALVRALAAHLKDGARVLNVSSDAAPQAHVGWGGYGMAKAALDHFSATLALEAPRWRVYAVDPGDMLTDMYRASYPGEPLELPPPEAAVPGFMALIEGDYPSGRYLAQRVRGKPGRSSIPEPG